MTSIRMEGKKDMSDTVNKKSTESSSCYTFNKMTNLPPLVGSAAQWGRFEVWLNIVWLYLTLHTVAARSRMACTVTLFIEVDDRSSVSSDGDFIFTMCVTCCDCSCLVLMVWETQQGVLYVYKWFCPPGETICSGGLQTNRPLYKPVSTKLECCVKYSGELKVLLYIS